jgi:hypothetical protein
VEGSGGCGGLHGKTWRVAEGQTALSNLHPLSPSDFPLEITSPTLMSIISFCGSFFDPDMVDHQQ